MITFISIKQRLKHSRIIMGIWSLLHRPTPMKGVSYGGENPDKTFYIIGREDMIGGGWSLINQILMHIAYAIEKGYLPVVDMRNYKNQYVDETEFHKFNIWERYFLQPAGYSLADISHCKNVLINSSMACPDKKYNISLGSNVWDDEEKLSFFRALFKKSIIYTDYMASYLEQQDSYIFNKHHHVIGVLCRGTDFLMNKPAGHEIQPDPVVVLADVKQEYEKGDYDAVFLATEDQDILELFITGFGDRLLYLDQPRVSKKEMRGDAWLSKVRNVKHPDENKDTAFLSYFAATYILSKCKCLFAGRTSGSAGALILPSHYSFVKLYNLGKY